MWLPLSSYSYEDIFVRWSGAENKRFRSWAYTHQRLKGVIAKRDRNQDWFHCSGCGEDYTEPLRFHLTLNMSLTALEKAVGIVLSVVDEQKVDSRQKDSS